MKKNSAVSIVSGVCVWTTEALCLDSLQR